MHPAEERRIAIAGTYPPRQCGIATFTQDLCQAIQQQSDYQHQCHVIAINDRAGGYNYPPSVRFEIRQQQPADYRLAADFASIRNCEVLLVQHEYGIFGGDCGEQLLGLLRNVRMPVVTTLHTVLAEPSRPMRNVTQAIIEHSDRIVVMSDRAAGILGEVYDLPAEKVRMIPHGIPDLSFVDPSFYKDQFGVEGSTVLLTFGLLSPGKGIEYVIRALPELVKGHPDLVYVVLGATHPHVLDERGEEYRHQLQHLAQDLGVLDHVMFVNRYVELDELCKFLMAADVYVTPSLAEQQIASGTLAYALGAGKPVVATPYVYAKELLADGRGRLVPFRDPEAIASEIAWLLGNQQETQAMRKRAYLYSRRAIWDEVARAYLDVFDEVTHQPSIATRRQRSFHDGATSPLHAVPEVDFSALRAMTDDVGILQHARCTTPDRNHGYCVDDNARALVVALQAYELTQDREMLNMARTYLSFVHHAFNPDNNRFRNFMSYDRRFTEEAGSEDSHARALWGLGFAVSLARHDGMRALALDLFDRGLHSTDGFTSPRAWAFTLVGVHAYLRRYGGDSEAKRIREGLANRLYDQFVANAKKRPPNSLLAQRSSLVPTEILGGDQRATHCLADPGGDWPWPEDTLTYSCGKLPHAMLLAGQWMQHDGMIDIGLRSLDWLLKIQTSEDGHLSLIGNRGWFPRGGSKAPFDQQPIEAHALLEACLEAHGVTKDDQWFVEARRCFDWFLGRNDLGRPIYNYETGGCRDGLHEEGVNENEGAESTVAWLLSLRAIRAAKLIQPAENPDEADQATDMVTADG